MDLRNPHLRKARQVGLFKVGVPEGIRPKAFKNITIMKIKNVTREVYCLLYFKRIVTMMEKDHGKRWLEEYIACFTALRQARQQASKGSQALGPKK